LVVKCTIRKIKENNHDHPMTICIIVYEETHDKVEKLHQMIDSENLLKDYTIYRQRDKFYLQWN